MMGKRKRGADENVAPLISEAQTCPSTKDDTVSKENLSCAPLLRHSHRYGRVYTRRKPTNKNTVSTSQSNVTKKDEKVSNLNNLPSELNTEKSEKSFSVPERSRPSSSLPTKVGYLNPSKMVCGLCDKFLKRKPFILENSVALDDLSVVAILVCGHVYHADCLEPKTSIEYQSDPLCPICVK